MGVPGVLGSALVPPWLAVTLWRPLVVPPCLLPCLPPCFGVGPQLKTVRALSTSATANEHVVPSSMVSVTVPASTEVTVPLNRRSPSISTRVLTATGEPTARSKCSVVRSLRSRPGLDTSRV